MNEQCTARAIPTDGRLDTRRHALATIGIYSYVRHPQYVGFILVMFGVLGGLAAFGMVGLFIGPVILAILMAVWREWVDEPGIPEQPNSASGEPHA